MPEGKKNKFHIDLLWHLAGSTLPLLVGFFRIPIFTRYFTAEEYGVYGIIFITYVVFSIFLYNWLASSIWRFYNKFKEGQKLPTLYSNLFTLYALFSAIFLIITLIWSGVTINELSKKLIILISIQLLIDNLNNYFLIINRLEEESARLNIIVSLRVGVAFGIQYFLTFRMGLRIEAIPIAMAIAEGLILCYQIPRFLSRNKVSFSLISLDTIKLFLGYSVPGILSNVGIFILTSSDRYVIALFGEMNEVGIYNQVYNLCQVSTMAIVNLFFAIINPGFLKELEVNFGATNKLTSIYMRNYMLILMPIVIYMSIFSYWTANILLGEDFRTGYNIIPWIASAIFIYGLTLFPENRLKFKSKYKLVIIGFLTSSFINIGLNFLFVPIFGYKWAAITTTISYLILAVFFYWSDIKHSSFSFSGWKDLLPACITLGLQTVIYFIIKARYNPDASLKLSIVIGFVFALTYLFSVFLFSGKTIKLLIRIYNRK